MNELVYLQYVFVFLAVATGVAVMATPLVVYLLSGWNVKKNEIMDGLSATAREKYFLMFSLGTVRGRSDAKPMNFETFYLHFYGRRFFITPLLLLIVVLLYACTSVAFTALHKLPLYAGNGGNFDLPVPAVAAIAGAYMWVASDFISRARRLDFSPADVHWGTLRLVVAVPMGYAFASLAPSLAPAVAFSLGAFPLSAIVAMLQRVFLTATRQAQDTNTSSDTVKHLQGIDESIANRLAAEDLTTIAQVAYCDPVRIVMRSNLTFNFVIDCMNQALAWLYFEDQMKILRPLGLRGAAEISYLVDELVSRDDAVRNMAEATLADVVKAIQPPHTVLTMRSTFKQIADDPYTSFLREIWINPFEQKMNSPGASKANSEGDGSVTALRSIQ